MCHPRALIPPCACKENKNRARKQMRAGGYKVGREVTTRILYIPGTFTIRISPGGCCHVPLGHVPGVRPRGLRASSRASHDPSSAPISPLFLPCRSSHSRAPSVVSPFFLPAGSTRQIPQEKNGGDRSVRTVYIRSVYGSGERKGSSPFAHTLHPLVHHVHLASGFRIASMSRARRISVFRSLEPDPRITSD